MILIIDNYDSFTYNLVQYIGSLGNTVRVVRNDEHKPSDTRQMSPEGIIVSPGPGRPEEAGCSNEMIRRFADEVPILGVCLGHQCIAREFGASVTGADRLMHGKTSTIHHHQNHLFSDVPSPFSATRYHSLIVDDTTLSTPLVKTAETDAGELMGLRHRRLPLYGIQFHPESIMTEHGLRLMENFCRICHSFSTSPLTPCALS